MYLSLAEEVMWDDEACDAFGLVEKTDEGYKLSMEMPSSLHRFIIGRRGETKRKIEKDTGTRIWIPRQGQEGDVGETFNQIYIILKSKPTLETTQNAKICWLLVRKFLLQYRTLTTG